MSREAPATWEALVERAPHKLEAFPPENGLERWEKDEVRRLEDEQRARQAPLDIAEVTGVFRGAISEHASPLEREIVSGLAMFAFGKEHVEAALRRFRRRFSDAPPFSSFVEVLHVALYGAQEMGMGSPMPSTVDPAIPQRHVQHPNPARVGYDYGAMKQSRSGSTGGCRSLGAVERRLDAKRAVAASFLGPVEVWMLALVYCGEMVKWGKDKGGKLGRLEKRKRSEVAALYRHRACLCAAKCSTAATGCKLGRVDAKCPTQHEDVHADACPAKVSDRAIVERITRARERLTTALVTLKLIPEPRSRIEGAKKKPKPVRDPIEPVRAHGGW